MRRLREAVITTCIPSSSLGLLISNDLGAPGQQGKMGPGLEQLRLVQRTVMSRTALNSWAAYVLELKSLTISNGLLLVQVLRGGSNVSRLRHRCRAMLLKSPNRILPFPVKPGFGLTQNKRGISPLRGTHMVLDF